MLYTILYLTTASAFFCSLHCTEHFHDCIEADQGMTKATAKCSFEYGLCEDGCDSSEDDVSDHPVRNLKAGCGFACKSTADCNNNSFDSGCGVCNEGYCQAQAKRNLKAGCGFACKSTADCNNNSFNSGCGVCNEGYCQAQAKALQEATLAGSYGGAKDVMGFNVKVALKAVSPGYFSLSVTGAPGGNVNCPKLAYVMSGDKLTITGMNEAGNCAHDQFNAADLTLESATYNAGENTITTVTKYLFITTTIVCDHQAATLGSGKATGAACSSWSECGSSCCGTGAGSSCVANSGHCCGYKSNGKGGFEATTCTAELGSLDRILRSIAAASK